MLRWFPRLEAATAWSSCSPPELNILDPYFIFMYIHYNHFHRATAHLQLNILLVVVLFNFFLDRILICYDCSQIFDLFHPLKEIIMFLLWLRPNWYTVQKFSCSLTVSALPIANTRALMSFTVTAGVPFRVKDAQYLCVYLSPSKHCGISLRLHVDKHQWRHMHRTS